MGETTIRFGRVRSLSVIGSKRCGIALHCVKQEARQESGNVREFVIHPTAGLHFFAFGDDGFSVIVFTGVVARIHS